MRIIAESTLKEYWERHADARGQLEAWRDFVYRAKWNTPQDVQKDYGDDVILPNNRAVFNIKGNSYRLVVEFHYKSQIVLFALLVLMPNMTG